VYRHLDIGTAKPLKSLRRLIPHHLIDCLDPDSQFTVGDFVRSAESLVEEIRGKQKIPLLSGGTAYYLRHFLVGLPETPSARLDIRQCLVEREKEEGVPALYVELERVDPAAARKIHPNDRYRIQRALEVWYSTGRRLSSYQNPSGIRRDFSLLVIGLRRDRIDIHERIQNRVEWMFRQGLRDEVKRLIRMGYRSSDPGMKGIGYREFFSMRTGCLDTTGVKELITRNSRRYAKRQMTFFKSIPLVQWHHPDDVESIRRRVGSFLGQS
jgi:tRNA dimethylallyltransferase